MNNPDTTGQGVLLLLAAVYFAPAIIATLRGHLSGGAITVLNIFLGWTALGWIIALVWSFTGNTKNNLRVMSGFAPSPKPLDRIVGYRPPDREPLPGARPDTVFSIARDVYDNIVHGTPPDQIRR